ncbi:hypothetical protein BaRGS_00016770 [Batillaria attramentaria]|uniref:Uncharacterized protein n=1 Tax=Batillaria attramentaria TaxID=370345 RepID=A0ABD0KXG1_9CAEN
MKCDACSQKPDSDTEAVDTRTPGTVLKGRNSSATVLSLSPLQTKGVESTCTNTAQKSTGLGQTVFCKTAFSQWRRYICRTRLGGCDDKILTRVKNARATTSTCKNKECARVSACANDELSRPQRHAVRINSSLSDAHDVAIKVI